MKSFFCDLHFFVFSPNNFSCSPVLLKYILLTFFLYVTFFVLCMYVLLLNFLSKDDDEDFSVFFPQIFLVSFSACFMFLLLFMFCFLYRLCFVLVLQRKRMLAFYDIILRVYGAFSLHFTSVQTVFCNVYFISKFQNDFLCNGRREKENLFKNSNKIITSKISYKKLLKSKIGFFQEALKCMKIGLCCE